MSGWSQVDRFVKWLVGPSEPWFERGEITFANVTFPAVRIRFLGMYYQHPRGDWLKIRQRWVELLFIPNKK